MKIVLVISVVYVFINVLYLVLDFLLGSLYKHIDTVELMALKTTPKKTDRSAVGVYCFTFFLIMGMIA